MLISPDAARKLNLPVKRVSDGETELLAVPFPKFQATSSIPSGVHSNELLITKEVPWGDLWGQAFLGQTWFTDRVWYLDYRNHEVSYLPESSSYDTSGFHSQRIGFQVDDEGRKKNAFARIQASIDGELFDFLFDTGATVQFTQEAKEYFSDESKAFAGISFIVQSLFERWASRHPEWVVIENADSLGNEPMIQVPRVEIAGYKVGPVWFTRRSDRNFHEYMSQGMDRRIDGALGGSFLKYFSIIIDYLDSIIYFKR